VGWTAGVRFPARAKDIRLLQSQDRLWGHPAFYPRVQGALSLGVKRPEREADDSSPRSTMVELYLHSHICLHGVVLNNNFPYQVATLHTLRMDTGDFSEMLATIYQITRRHALEECDVRSSNTVTRSLWDRKENVLSTFKLLVVVVTCIFHLNFQELDPDGVICSPVIFFFIRFDRFGLLNNFLPTTSVLCAS
jgi:hypothetical protein